MSANRLIGFLGVLYCCFATLTAEASDPKDELIELDAYLSPLLATNNFAGVVLLKKQGEIVFIKGFGLSNIEESIAHTPTTRFQVASLSKPFTSAGILLLAQRGELDLEAPLNKVLPEYPEGHRLTIHHLLSHTSGIPNINDFPEYGEFQKRPHTTEELVAYFKDEPLVFEPGERYAYSNSNYNLLALIIERVSGLSYERFLEREILNPLGLSSTGHRARMTEIIPDLATGYEPQGSLELQIAQYLDWSNKTGNGSLYSTAGDLATFARSLHGSQLLTTESRVKMYHEHSTNVGYGWFVTEANGKKIHHINGRSPGWAAQLDHYVQEDVTVVVLSNIYSPVTTRIARAVGAMHFGLPVVPLPDFRDEPLTDAEVARLTGTYRFGEDYYLPNSIVTIVGINGEIHAEYASGYTPSAYIPISSTDFIVRPFWMPAKFVMGSDGRAAELVLDGFRGLRQ